MHLGLAPLKHMKRYFFTCFLAIAALAAPFASPAFAQSADNPEFWHALKQPGAIVLFRHANAPGGGDPAGFRLNDCTTQRNLDAEGREQATRIGQRFREKGIKVSAVLSSQWCRARETAQLAFPGMQKDAAAFNSFLRNPNDEPKQTIAARKILQDWQGAGALVVVAHQVNITRLTGIYPASGEGVVVKRQGSELVVVARLTP
jgi:phosphohistidine phosphatase SixA